MADGESPFTARTQPLSLRGSGLLFSGAVFRQHAMRQRQGPGLPVQQHRWNASLTPEGDG